MDQIFQERDDADTVQWTYHDFRTAYPETNTEVALSIDPEHRRSRDAPQDIVAAAEVVAR